MELKKTFVVKYVSIAQAGQFQQLIIEMESYNTEGDDSINYAKFIITPATLKTLNWPNLNELCGKKVAIELKPQNLNSSPPKDFMTIFPYSLTAETNISVSKETDGNSLFPVSDYSIHLKSFESREDMASMIEGVSQFSTKLNEQQYQEIFSSIKNLEFKMFVSFM